MPAAILAHTIRPELSRPGFAPRQVRFAARRLLARWAAALLVASSLPAAHSDPIYYTAPTGEWNTVQSGHYLWKDWNTGQWTYPTSSNVVAVGLGSVVGVTGITGYASTLSIGFQGVGAVGVSAGGVLDVGTAYVGADNNGSLDLKGSTLYVRSTTQNLVVGHAADGVFTMRNSSTLSVASGGITLGANQFTVGTLNFGSLNDTSPVGSMNALSIASGAGKGVVNFQSGFMFTPNAVFSGSLTLNQLGTGTTYLLGGAGNTYVGGTYVGAGTLVTNAASLPGNIHNDATLIFEQLSSGTYGGVIAGAGVVRKQGAGDLTLSATNPHTGGTIVEAGTLTLNGTTANGIGLLRGAVTIASGAVVNLPTANALGYANGARVDTVLITGGSLLNSSSNDQGWGINYQLNGATLISNGGLNSNTASSKFAFGGGTAVTATGAPSTISGRVDLRGDGGVTNVNFTVDGGSTLNVAAAVTSTYGNVGLTKLGAGTLSLTGPNTYSGLTVVNGGLLIGSSQSLPGAIVNQSSLRFDQASTGTYASVISGSGSVQKTGAGHLTLNAAQTYTGGTVVDGGTLTLAGSPAAGVGIIRGNLTINSGATVNASIPNALGYLTGSKVNAVTINGGTLLNSAASDQGWGISYTLNGATMASNGGVNSATTPSSFTFGGGTSVIASGAPSTISGRVNLRGDGGVTNVDFTVGSGSTLSIPAAITSTNGSVGLSKLGAGELVLSGPNTYSGGTVVSGGTLTLPATLAAGAGVLRGTLTINAGAMVNATAVNAFGYATGAKLDTVAIHGGTLLSPAAGDQGWGIAYTLNGATMTSNGGVNSPTAASRFAFGHQTSVTANGTPSMIAGRIDLRGDLGDTSVNFTVGTNATLSLPAAITSTNGNVGLTKLGPGTLTLSGPNTYTGPTVVNGGLIVGASSNFPGPITNHATVRLAQSQAETYPHVISGTGAVEIMGAGPLTLTSVQTYTGGTTVNASSLRLDASSFSASGMLRGNLALLNGATVEAASVNALGTNAGSRVDTITLDHSTFTSSYAGPQGWAAALSLTSSQVISNGGINSPTAYPKLVFHPGASVSASGAAPSTISGRVDLLNLSGTTNYSLNLNGSDSQLLIPASITSSLGAVGLIKQGSGKLVLLGDNMYGGNTYIQAGRVNSKSNTAFGTGEIFLGQTGSGQSAVLIVEKGTQLANPITTSSGGTPRLDILAGGVSNTQTAATLTGTLSLNSPIRFSAFSEVLSLSGRITGNPTDFYASSELLGKVILSNPLNDFTGTITVENFSTLQAGNSTASEVLPNSNTLNLSGTLQLAGPAGSRETVGSLRGVGNVTRLGTGQQTLAVGARNIDDYFNGSIQGNLALVKVGTGTQTLLGGGTFTGGTVISQGQLAITHAGALSSGGVVLGDAATGTANVGFSLADTAPFASEIRVSAQGTGTATLSAVGITGTRTLSGLITLERSATFLNQTSSTFQLTSKITGNAPLVTLQGGTTTLTNSLNDFTGNLQLTGNVQLSASAGAIPSSAGIQINAGSKLEFSGASGGADPIGALQGTGMLTQTSARSLLLGQGGASGTFQGNLQVASLTKVGTGTQELDFTTSTVTVGSIDVEQGTLTVKGTLNPTGIVTIDAGATLLNHGTLLADVTSSGSLLFGASATFEGIVIASGGSLAGDFSTSSTAALYASDFTLQAGSTLSSYLQLTAGGTMLFPSQTTLAGDLAVAFPSSYVPTVNDRFFVIYGGSSSVAGSFANVTPLSPTTGTFVADNMVFLVNYADTAPTNSSSNNVTLTYQGPALEGGNFSNVPEPASLILGASGALLLLARRRRRPHR